jgi:outer membrane murein-binding lipoprotein Lpp|tara:strand:+ start:1063 stop:1335 length:273 start_codon:yes stop_codon:yes gene_type:complete
MWSCLGRGFDSRHLHYFSYKKGDKMATVRELEKTVKELTAKVENLEKKLTAVTRTAARVSGLNDKLAAVENSQKVATERIREDIKRLATR